MRLCNVVASDDGLTVRQREGGMQLDDANMRGSATCAVVLHEDVVVRWLWRVDGDERLRFESESVRGNEGRRNESSI